MGNPVLRSLLVVGATAVSGHARRGATVSLVVQVEGLAARQPVLLVVEDAHWADPTSLELFELIVERAPSLPLLAIVTFRPDETIARARALADWPAVGVIGQSRADCYPTVQISTT